MYHKWQSVLFCRCFAIFLSVGMIERVVALETALHAGVGDCVTGIHILMCQEETLLGHIAADGVAGLGFEQVHHIGWVQKERRCDRLAGKILRQMLINIFHDTKDCWIGGICRDETLLIAKHPAIQVNQIFKDLDTLHQGSGKAILLG